MFSRKYNNIFENTYFEEHLRTAASENGQWLIKCIRWENYEWEDNSPWRKIRKTYQGVAVNKQFISSYLCCSRFVETYETTALIDRKSPEHRKYSDP